MTHPQPPNTANQPTTRETLTALGRLIRCVLAPGTYLAAWHVTHRAVQPKTWSRSRRRKRAATATLLGPLLAAIAIYNWAALTRGHSLITGLALGLVVLWSATAPTIPLAWMWRRARIATDIDLNRFDQDRAHHVRKAMWTGNGRDAAVKAATAHWWTGPTTARYVLGVLVHDNRADWHRRRSIADGESTRSDWIHKDRLVLPHGTANAILVASSGSGKSVLAADLCAAILRERGSAVYFNCKGAHPERARLAALATALAVPFIEWTFTDDGFHGHPFDAWIGSREAIVSRLGSSLGAPTSDAGAFYQANTLAILRRVAAQRREPWANSSQALADLAAFRARDVPAAELARVTKDLQRALSGIAQAIDGRDHPKGWSWDLTGDQPLMVLVNVDPANRAALAAAVLMLTDLISYKESRVAAAKHPPIKRLVVLDEAQVLQTAPVPPDTPLLMEQLRSSGISLVVTAQSISGLGDPDTANRLLDSGAALLAGQMNTPEAIVERAGTEATSERGEQGDARGLTGMTSSRAQKRFKLDPDRVRSFPAGHFALIERGHAYPFVALPERSWRA